MPSRAELNIRARNVGLDATAYANDSKLEQRVIFEEKSAAANTGALAVGTITASAAFANAETVTIGEKVYTFVTALTEAAATATLTAGGTFADGEKIGIGDITYTMRTTLTTTPYEVLIGANAAASLDNLKVAINAGATAGTNYSLGTVAHPEVTATTNTDTTQVVQFTRVGTDGNLLSVSENCANAAWGAENLSGGVNPVWGQIKVSTVAATDLDNLKDAINGTVVVAAKGTDYSSNTTAHPSVTATTNDATTQVVQAISFDEGEDIATTETCANAAWGATTLASGTPKVIASVAADNAAVSGGARV